MATESGQEPSTSAPRPLPLVGSPWFWALLVGALFGVPLIKGLGAPMPTPLPGVDETPITFTLLDDAGREVTERAVRGRVVVVSELPLADAKERATTFEALRKLRKRLKGLGDTVAQLVFCYGGDAIVLGALLDEMTARKPGNVFLLDEGRAASNRIKAQARAPSAEFLLLDRHGRVRGVYARAQGELDQLVADAGLLANWPQSDPPP